MEAAAVENERTAIVKHAAADQRINTGPATLAAVAAQAALAGVVQQPATDGAGSQIVVNTLGLALDDVRTAGVQVFFLVDHVQTKVTGETWDLSV